MIPTIIQLGPIPVNSFGLMVALAIIAGSARLQQSFVHSGINPKLADSFAFSAGIVGLIGARIWYIIEDYSVLKDDLLDALLSSAGFTFYGGFIFASLFLLIQCMRHHIRISDFLDSVGPAMALSYAIGRLGCQLSGDGDYGIRTTSIWGMSYSSGVVPTPDGVLVYPTPFFESVLALVVLFVLTRIENNAKWFATPYSRFGMYIALAGLARLVVEFIRVNPIIAFGLSEAQLVSIVLILIGVTLITIMPKLKHQR